MKEAHATIQEALSIMEHAIKAGDWKPDGACDPANAIVRMRSHLGLEPYDSPYWNPEKPAYEY